MLFWRPDTDMMVIITVIIIIIIIIIIVIISIIIGFQFWESLSKLIEFSQFSNYQGQK